LAAVVIVAVVTGFVLRAGAENPDSVLVLGLPLGQGASGVAQEKGFALWVKLATLH
jgi:hypothetical protein